MVIRSLNCPVVTATVGKEICGFESIFNPWALSTAIEFNRGAIVDAPTLGGKWFLKAD